MDPVQQRLGKLVADLVYFYLWKKNLEDLNRSFRKLFRYEEGHLAGLHYGDYGMVNYREWPPNRFFDTNFNIYPIFDKNSVLENCGEIVMIGNHLESNLEVPQIYYYSSGCNILDRFKH